MKIVATLLSISFYCVTFSNPAFSFQRDNTYAKTQFPIVFAHGAAGFDRIGPIDYWYGIPSDLASRGANVYLTQVSSFGTSEERGEQLLAQVEEILAITGAAKVNLIGHSHGSHSSRYVAAVIPDRIASVTSVGGPNKGSAAADWVAHASELAGPEISGSLASLVDAFGTLIGLAAGELLQQDASGVLHATTTIGAAEFNSRYPAGIPITFCGEGDYVVDNVRYYSWSGTKPVTNILDPFDLSMLSLSAAFVGTRDPDNDGLVGRCSSHLGNVIRDDYQMNHLDEVNQVLGLTYWLETNPVVVFRNHANRLKNVGL